MLDPELPERTTARRVELDGREQLADERASAAPMPGQVGGQAVMLIPQRAPGVEEARSRRSTSASLPP
ncbi:hypothetical protein AB0L26_21970 [Streptomyces nondiastaticus]|uniref:hypothetical protein n=1 Tax=Streptomyces nondiastaticus TaxID=3154512 RepID=UPI003419D772